MPVTPALRRSASAVARLDPWAPPLALMAVIFFFSAQSDLNSGLGVIDLIGRKAVHAAEYALLALLWWRALRTTRLGERRALGVAFAVAVAYAASDEWHQTFVPGRHGSPLDVAIDATGAALATLALRSRLRAPDRR
jgi:VanZ family protein